MKESTRVLVALAAAIGSGALIAASGSKALIDAADALAPVGTLWVNAIRMTVIPLVVSLLITGVVSAADLGAIGRIGGRTLVVFGLLLAAIAAIVVRSEERRVGKECRCRWALYHYKKIEKNEQILQRIT